jgi:hypothetical protein
MGKVFGLLRVIGSGAVAVLQLGDSLLTFAKRLKRRGTFAEAYAQDTGGRDLQRDLEAARERVKRGQ